MLSLWVEPLAWVTLAVAQCSVFVGLGFYPAALSLGCVYWQRVSAHRLPHALRAAVLFAALLCIGTAADDADVNLLRLTQPPTFPSQRARDGCSSRSSTADPGGKDADGGVSWTLCGGRPGALPTAAAVKKGEREEREERGRGGGRRRRRRRHPASTRRPCRSHDRRPGGAAAHGREVCRVRDAKQGEGALWAMF